MLKHVTWDVKEFQGKTAHIEVYDGSEDSFVMVDSIIMSDDKSPKYIDIPDLLAIDLELQKWLEGVVKQELSSIESVATGSCIVSEGKVVAIVVAGERKYGSGVAIQENDAFQMGSVSKTLTATLTGIMVESGVIEWNTKLVDVFPELVPEGNPYRNVTVLQMLTHTAGLPHTSWHMLSDEDGRKDQLARYPIFVRECVKQAPVNTPGTKYGYSNAGPVIVSAMLARITGMTYEQMLQEYIVKPLGLRNTSARAAIRADLDPTVKFVWQHNMKDGKITPEEPVGWGGAMEVMSACGGVNMCIMDQALFMISHMQNNDGPRLLSNDSLEFLHTVVVNDCTDPNEEACPGLMRLKDGPHNILGPAFWHPGMNGMNFAAITIVPSASFGYAFCYNLAGSKGPFILESSLIKKMIYFKKK
jgi:CubicO group peptidase (beta-lactamase class C family)